jgi:hypothetical protein
MIKILPSLDPFVDVSEIRRLLGARNPAEQSSKRTEELIQRAVEISSEVSEACGTFGFFESASLTKSSFLAGEKDVALAIATIGDALEKEVQRLSSSGELALAVTLDAAGSVTAEAAADEVNRHICEVANDRGLMSKPRFSPGYGKWDLSEQEIIFDLLPAERIGVSLTESSMMIPRKSVSFAVRFSDDGGGSSANPCENCGLKNCRMRRTK